MVIPGLDRVADPDPDPDRIRIILPDPIISLYRIFCNANLAFSFFNVKVCLKVYLAGLSEFFFKAGDTVLSRGKGSGSELC